MTAREPSRWMKTYEAGQAIRRAERWIALPLVLAPIVAATWANTCRSARLLQAGRFGIDGEPEGFVLDLLWMGIHRVFGMAGLHTVFGTLLAAVVAAGVWAFREHRRLLHDTPPEMLRELREGERRNAVRMFEAGGRPDLARLAAAPSPPPVMPPRHRWRLLAIVIRLVPIALVALTVLFVLSALRS